MKWKFFLVLGLIIGVALAVYVIKKPSAIPKEAVVVFGEAFSPDKMVAFGCIWGAVGLYAADSFYGYQRRALEAASDEMPEQEEPVAIEVPAATPCGCDG